MPNNIFSTSIENWLDNYTRLADERGESAGAKIHVSEAASRLAFVYEKIRNTIDYKEDHLIRKSAITRIIKRFLVTGKKGSDLALPLISELIAARYLPNDEIPERTIYQVRDVLNKYIVIYNAIIDRGFCREESKDFYEWLIHLAGCELEELLVPSERDHITVEAMHRIVRQSLIIDDESTSDSEKKIQIYIAVLKSLMKSDEVTVNYHLLKYYFPDWAELTLVEAERLAIDIKNKQTEIKAHFFHPLNERLTKELKRYAVVFWTLQEVIILHPGDYRTIFENQKTLTDAMNKVCAAKYKTIKGKVRRAIVRSVLYIFLTKIIFGVVLELPYDYFILSHLAWPPLAINALFPPILMAIIGSSIKTPKKNNTEQIIAQALKIVYNQNGREHRVKCLKKKKGIGSYILKFFYLVMYAVSFGAIIWGLHRLNFSPASMAIFLLFLTLVSFFSLRIRKNAAELIIIEKKEGFRSVFFSFLTIPLLRVGRWISMNSSKINILIFIFDFIIESPFKMFVRIFEDLIVFIKEKRDEMM